MPHQPFLALITPLGSGDGPPVQPPIQPPLGIWGPTDPRPTPPIAGPGRPPWWGMANDPGYGIPVGPGVPPGYWGPPDPRPTPPIAGPGRPPWWGMAQDPGYGVPVPPSPPFVIWGPGDPRPTLPIAGWDPGTGAFPKPPGIWGPTDPRPTNPISGWNPATGNFPELPAEVPDLGPVEWKAIWTPQTGWAVIGIPTGTVPTPSAK